MDAQTLAAANADVLESELLWFNAIVQQRIKENQDSTTEKEIPEPPDLDSEVSIFANFVKHYQMSTEERLVVLLALLPYIRPQCLDVFFTIDAKLNRGNTEFGGLQGKMHGGFLPTGETAMFLIAGNNFFSRFEFQQMFERDHYFARHNLVKLEVAPVGEPALSGALTISDELVDYLTRGELRKPDFSRDFPAKLISTEMEWTDLVLTPGTRDQIQELMIWMKHEKTLMHDWGLSKRLRPGYKALFYGPPGTGKTLTATLLGKKLDRDVYRIALSAVVSKYIGETEKNLDRIFATAENMECILFFDEADSLFGKRTNVSDAHDRYANQEVSYLLQRIEEFPGAVVLASNFSNNIDDAFMRRFQGVAYFPLPGAEERLAIWQGVLTGHSAEDIDWDIEQVANRFELSGGSIMNVIRYAALMAIDKDRDAVDYTDVINGIRRELQKEGKTL
ncbi:MAG: ATP-binding protein [Gammaproteobacteria bacterium]|nr:ATP-binding protein [Gammaproteobacteria bacterium]